jgi:hypothetical protein
MDILHFLHQRLLACNGYRQRVSFPKLVPAVCFISLKKMQLYRVMKLEMFLELVAGKF